MSTVPLPIIDPHFHVWNVHAHPNPTLGELGERLPVYSLLDYERDAGVGVAGYVHIETVVGQATSPPAGLDPVDETRAVLRQAAAEGRERQLKIVAFVKLSEMPQAEAVLAAHQAVAGDALVGVRMILNHSKEDEALTWPMVERGDYLTGGVPGFQEGFALLAQHGLSFDLQANWFQLKDAAAFLQQHGFQDMVVILDHMGCLKLTGTDEAEDAKRVAEWRAGMQALASLPNVQVKLSMLEYVRQGWMDPASVAHGVVKGLVRETIGLFGPARCMFASNFPVDKLLASLDSLEGLVAAQHALVADMDEEARRALFHDTAARVYKFIALPVSLAVPVAPTAPAAALAGGAAEQEQEQAGGEGAAVTATAAATTAERAVHGAAAEEATM